MNDTRKIIVAYTERRGRTTERKTASVNIPARATDIRVVAELDVEGACQDKSYIKVRLDGTSSVYTFRTHELDLDELDEGDRVTFQIRQSEGPKFGTVVGFGRDGYNGETKVARLVR